MPASDGVERRQERASVCDERQHQRGEDDVGGSDAGLLPRAQQPREVLDARLAGVTAQHGEHRRARVDRGDVPDARPASGTANRPVPAPTSTTVLEGRVA